MQAFFSDLLGRVVAVGEVTTHPKTGKHIQAQNVDGNLAWINLSGEEIPLTMRPNDERHFVKANAKGRLAQAEVTGR